MMKDLLAPVQRKVLAGLLFIVPIVVTVFAASFVYRTIDGLIGRFPNQIVDSDFWQNYLPQGRLFAPVMEFFFTLIFTVLILYFLGLISTTIVISRIYSYGERLVLRIPFIKTVYGLTKQASQLVMAQDKSAFKEMVLVEYPRTGVYALAFVTGELRVENDPRRFINVFLPTTPNPTSGFFLILPEDQVRAIDLPLEDGVKMLMSGGLISPDMLQTRAPEVPEIREESVMTKMADPSANALPGAGRD